jgi:L-cysteate sulfo-lyase
MLKFRRLSRAGIGTFPTPLERMPTLGEKLGGLELFVKREDLTGLAFGGNKVRQLDYLLGPAKINKNDAVVTTCGVQSNWSRQTTAAALKLGMKKVVLVLRTAQFRSPPAVLDGNTLLDSLMGARIRFVRMGIDEDPERYLEEEGVKLRAKGFNPVVLDVASATSAPTSAAYIEAMAEVADQAKALGVSFDVIVLASSSGSTQAGLTAGAKILGAKTKVIGINVGAYPNSVVERNIIKSGNSGSKLLGASAGLSPRDVHVLDDYAGKGYGIPTKESVEAIKLTARTEAVFLDPVYTSKAMAGLVDLAKSGELKRDDSVCFIHTGGLPAIFPYRSYLQPPKNQILK